MSTEAIKAIAYQLYEDFNEAFRTRNPNVLEETISANIVDHNPAPGQAPGLEGVKQYVLMFCAAFPDLQNTVEDLIAEGDKVVARLTVRGAHTGAFMGIPPTGKPVVVTLMEILRIADGKVVERWGQFDNLGLMQQLGVIPASG